MTPTPIAHVAPTRQTERVLTIDILRGFALLGILLVNMEMFNTSIYNFVLGQYPVHSQLDQAARWFIEFFAEGKFYSIFSFLFGLGMAIFMERAVIKGERFGPLWLRRMAALAAFGIIHALLFWVGDILLLYSLLGTLIFLLFRNRKPRTLVIWAGISLAVPILLNLLLMGALWAAQFAPGGAEAALAGMQAQEADWAARGAANSILYATGTFAQITAVRLDEATIMWSITPFMAFNVLATMLLGFAAGKAGWHKNIPARVPALRRIAIWGFIIGAIGNGLFVWGMEGANRMTVTPTSFLATTGQAIGAPAFALAYMAALTLLLERPAWKARFAPVGNAGRMAITNYLLQSTVATLLFYGYGLGLFGMGTFAGMLIALTIWLVQVGFSTWWLKRFRFGPVEWLWRVITYWKGQPMRKGSSVGGGVVATS